MDNASVGTAIDPRSPTLASAIEGASATPKLTLRNAVDFDSENIKIVVGEFDGDFSLWLHVNVDRHASFDGYQAVHCCYALSLEEGEEARLMFVREVGAILLHILHQEGGVDVATFHGVARKLAAFGPRGNVALRAAGRVLHTQSCLDATQSTH